MMDCDVAYNQIATSQLYEQPSLQTQQAKCDLWKLNVSKFWPDSGHSFANHCVVSVDSCSLH